MDSYDRTVAERFRQQLETLTSVFDLRVFGSRARGEASSESDLDLLSKALRRSHHEAACSPRRCSVRKLPQAPLDRPAVLMDVFARRSKNSLPNPV